VRQLAYQRLARALLYPIGTKFPCAAEGGMTNLANMGIDPVLLHHDLLIEIGRVEMILEDLLARSDDVVDAEVERLSARRAKLSAALSQLAH
jgi:hypothetical protein